jgi:hypothetical protein
MNPLACHGERSNFRSGAKEIAESKYPYPRTHPSSQMSSVRPY